MPFVTNWPYLFHTHHNNYHLFSCIIYFLDNHIDISTHFPIWSLLLHSFCYRLTIEWTCSMRLCIFAKFSYLNIDNAIVKLLRHSSLNTELMCIFDKKSDIALLYPTSSCGKFTLLCFLTLLIFLESSLFPLTSSAYSTTHYINNLFAVFI